MRRTGYYKVKLLLVCVGTDIVYTEIWEREAHTKKELRKIISNEFRAGKIPMRVTEHDKNDITICDIHDISDYITPHRAGVIIRRLTYVLKYTKPSRERNDLQYNAHYIYEHIAHLLSAEDKEAFEDVAYNWK